LLRRLQGRGQEVPSAFAAETERSEQLAMATVMEAERKLGFDPRDVSAEKRGYDIEASVPGTGCVRFIELKGRARGATTVTITKNEILTALNKPDEFILAIGLVDGDRVELRYIRRPFQNEPDFLVTSSNFALDELFELGTPPA
jgi:hypothetical protein